MIIRSVIEAAREVAAPAIEAYPTDPWDEPRSYRGALSTYRALGFREIDREPDGDSAILLMELELGLRE